MGKLVCEVCGSTEIVKEDGLFLCRQCGCRYTLEELRKMAGAAEPAPAGTEDPAEDAPPAETPREEAPAEEAPAAEDAPGYAAGAEPGASYRLAAALRLGPYYKTGKTLEEGLEAAERKIGFLTELLRAFDAAAPEISRMKEYLNALNTRRSWLQAQQNALGVFAFQERQQLELAMQAAAAERQNAEESFRVLVGRTGGYESREDIERDIADAEVLRNALRYGIESGQTASGTISGFEKACAMYREDRAAALSLYAGDPAACLIPAWYGKSDLILFGRAAQRENAGPEPVEWRVLKREGDRMLAVSRYALDCRCYHDIDASVTWETCTLRQWLNGPFLNGTFTPEELRRIPVVTVKQDLDMKLDSFFSSALGAAIAPGNPTKDRVFLLGINEAESLLASDAARKCAPTDCAVARGAWTSGKSQADGRAACAWWLRSRGADFDTAAVCNDFGQVDPHTVVSNRKIAVRPALWIDCGPELDASRQAD